MTPWYLILLGTPLLTLAQAEIGAFLPPPWTAVDPTLILAVGFIVAFRPRQALAVALISGFILDVLTAAPPGAAILARTAAVLAATAAFTRVFTNLSYLSFAALNALVYIMSRLIFTLVCLAVGWPGVIRIADGKWTAWTAWFSADLAAHLAVALFLVFLVRKTGHFFLKRFWRAK